MDMILFKKEVVRMEYNSLEKAFEDFSKLIYLVYVKRIEDKFIFELKNGEIFTMDNEEIFPGILTEKYYEESILLKKIRIAADWKKTENYESLDEIEKFSFIRHEISLKDSLEKLKELTKRTKGRFLNQRDLIDEIADIYGYLKRKKKIFEVYLGNDYEHC
jgi:hypothetical protein